MIMLETASPYHVLSNTDSHTHADQEQGPDTTSADPEGLEMISKDTNAANGTTTNGADEAHLPSSSSSSSSSSRKMNGHVRGQEGERQDQDQQLEQEAEEEEEEDGCPNGREERPAKRQRLRDSTPPPPPLASHKPKRISPPWKKIHADGPSTYLENGRRKSGRINSIPFELQVPEKKNKQQQQQQQQQRTTRHSLNGTAASTPKKKDEPATSGKTSKMPVHTNNTSSKKRSATKAASESVSKSASSRRVATAAAASSESRSTRPLRRRTLSPTPQPSRHSIRSRRTRHADDTDKDDRAATTTASRSSRIRLRVHPRSSAEIPLVHPGQVRKRPRIANDFNDFWQRSGDIPVEDGGLFTTEDGPPYTDEMAQREARVVLRIEKEAEPGGLLSLERCSLFVPEPEEEPPRQWARQDHMMKAVGNLRKLMLAEQQRHKATARKLAEACRDEWIRRQPKSAEQIEAEQKEQWEVRYRVVIKALLGTWENVTVEVNRRRLERWEMEEQKRVKAALNQAVSLSEQKLQARQAGGLDFEMVSDEDDFDMSDDASEGAGDEADEDSVLVSGESGESDEDDDDEDEDEDSDIMSSSGEEDEEDEDHDGDDLKHAADENLTQEQLRAKYANIPAIDFSVEEKDSTLEPATGPSRAGSVALEDGNGDEDEDEDETSDESIDMDDDLGSSDMDDSDASDGDGSSGDESGSEEDDEDQGGHGLLGLLFGKSELKKLKLEASRQDSAAAEDNAETPSIKQEQMNANANENANLSPAAAAAAALDLDEMIDDEDAISLVHHPDSVKGGLTPPPEQDAPEAMDQTPDARMDSEPAIDGIHMEVDETNIIGDSALASKDISPVEKPATPQGSKETATPAADPEQQQQQQQPAPIPDKELEEIDAALEVHAKVSKSKSGTVEPSPAPSFHKIDVPFLLRGTLREYQRQGLDWLAGLYANNTNGILADEMGLGKTIQTIALLAHLACQHGVWGPHLVIVPTSVMLNWEMEFKKWCPGFKILAYYGSQEERKRKRQGWNNDDVWNVCITSYQLVLQDQQVFRRRRWHYMILDEAHNIKNFKSQRWQTLLGFNTHSRLLLTGTPLQNNLTELWSLLFFLMPAENGVGGFADLQEFHDWFRKPESQILESGRDQMDEEAKAIIGKLHKVLRPYLLRRLKADVEKQMPAKFEHVEFCRLSKRQRELYDGFLARSDTRDTLASSNYLSIINCLMQLRKVCNHPDLFVDRPIMTSFRMQRSVAVEYEHVERLVSRNLTTKSPMSSVNLGFLNMIPSQHEHLSTTQADSIAHLSSHRVLMDLREAQRARAQKASANLDPSTVETNIAYLESAARWERFEELQHCVYLNALRRQQRPIYGKNVVDLLTIHHTSGSLVRKPRPQNVPQRIMDWFQSDTDFVRALTPTLDQRADGLKMVIEKFSCVTPAVVTRDLDRIALGEKRLEAFTEEDLRLSAPVRWSPFIPKQPPTDPWHEARMRLTIQFPDKRLLQYDCGKLQALDKLLRRLQAGGHRALIFTQMTKVLDILEQFLNIHGHKYLRLDGATKVEQRQILTDRFNHDPRILCFILSTRSGGLGINLTGADTVIFYDQDWNPAMDKQCQDRCHRIGQTRDVHIYRLVSEHTIEANILRKASQKQMLDDVVIQEGEFTTDSFNRMSVRDVLGEKADFIGEGIAAADAALDLVLGGGGGGPEGGSRRSDRRVGRVFEQAEDKEDVDAARVVEKEIQADDADFTEKAGGGGGGGGGGGPGSGASTARQGTPAGKSILDGGIGMLDQQQPVLEAMGVEEEDMEYNAWGDKMGTIDDYMVSAMMELLKHTKLELPKNKKKGKKKGKDTRKR